MKFSSYERQEMFNQAEKTRIEEYRKITSPIIDDIKKLLGEFFPLYYKEREKRELCDNITRSLLLLEKNLFEIIDKEVERKTANERQHEQELIAQLKHFYDIWETNKIAICSLHKPNSEQEVLFLFCILHKLLGFEEILSVNIHYPDIIAVRNKNEVRIELERTSTGFINHIKRGQTKFGDICVCWRASSIPLLFENGSPVEVIAMEDVYQRYRQMVYFGCFGQISRGERVFHKCKTCGQTWSPTPSRFTNIRTDYWKCPNGHSNLEAPSLDEV
jgi:hypothetical protein